LRNHEVLEGQALDTITTPDKQEFLIIDNGQKQQIELSQLKTLEVLTANAQFREVMF